MEPCRFCMEEAPVETLIEPCLCRGSIRYVHPECLEQEYKQRIIAHLTVGVCQICHTRYTIPWGAATHVWMPMVTLPISLWYVTVHVKHPVALALMLSSLILNWLLLLTPWFGFAVQEGPRTMVRWSLRISLWVAVLSDIVPAMRIYVFLFTWLGFLAVIMGLTAYYRRNVSSLKLILLMMIVMEGELLLVALSHTNELYPGACLILIGSLMLPIAAIFTMEV